MRYGILGPLQIDDGTVALAQGRQRLLLAVLLVHANEPVSADVLLEALWDDAAPPTALRSLHNLIGSLRKALGDGVLVTQGRAYALRVFPGELDVERFEHLAERGRLREALVLWRGPAFGELAGERALRDEGARLEERRLTVLEARIDADLESGRHAALVAELYTLVAAHPLRERLRALQMLALYRCGRQAEALHAYSEARRHLVSELGVEPGPALRELERAVLAHDPSLGAPTALPPSPRRRRRWRGAIAAALVSIAAIVAVAASGDPPPPRPPAPQPAVIASDVLAAIDPATNRVMASVPVGAAPVSVAVGAGAAWSLSGDDMTLSRVDLRSGRVRTFTTGGPPIDLAVGGGAVWVSQAQSQASAASDFDEVTTPAAVARLDPQSGVAGARASLPLPARAADRVPPGDLTAFGGDAAWVISRPGWLHRVDLASGRRTTLRSLHAMRVATGGDQVWVASASGALLQLDPRNGRRLARVPVAAVWITAIAVGGGAAWVTDKTAGTLWRIDARTRVARTVAVGAGADSLAFGEGAAWVGNSVRGTVTRVDAVTDRTTAVIAVGGTPRALAVGGSRVWVGVSNAALSASAARGLRTVSAPCGPVLTGHDGDPDLLLASDFPLQSQQQVTQPMADAVAFVLRRREFRAGRFRVGLQSCDDATAQNGVWDGAKCAANARAYAANPAVVGVIGPFDTGCAEKMLPILRPASVALISPTASTPAPVRQTSWPGYARLFPPDDSVTAAGAIAASRLGDSVFFLEDREYSAPRGARVWFERAAGRIGLRIAGRAQFSVEARDYRRLARRVRASGARVVYLNITSESNVQRLLRDLRSTLGADLPVVADFNALPAARLWAEAGRLARGLHVVSHAIGVKQLGEASREVMRAFSATQPESHVSSVALYATAATELLLDAIARSDGTRTSIVRELAGERAPMLLRGLGFQANGNTEKARVVLSRVENGNGDPSEMASLDGTVFESIIEVPPSLVE